MRIYKDRIRKGRIRARLILIGVAPVLLVVFLWRAAPIEIITSAHFHGSKEGGAIALSFDDGPDWGEEVLISALNQAGIRATFFWTWQKVEMLSSEDPQRFAGILHLLRDGDHEVGIHGFRCDVSSNLISRVLGFTKAEDLTRIQQNFSSLLGREPALYRPHGVQLGRQLLTAVKAAELRLVLGSPAYQIGQRNPARSYLRAIEKAKPGDIICGHDSKDCYSDFGLAGEIAQIVHEIQEILARRSLSLTTISEIL